MAGPWPRAEDGVFLSFSGERDRDGNSYVSLYGEYGLSPRSTLGFELGRSNADESSVTLWWQRALDRGQGPNRWTISTGIGMLDRKHEYLPLAQMGAAWGRGLDTIPWLRRLPGGGWLAAELRIKVAGATKDQAETQELAAADASFLAYITPETVAKSELTFGWHATDSLMLINQLQLEDRDDTGFSSKLAISGVRDLWGPAKLELGVIAPLSGSGEVAVKLGSWLEF
ncbi:hypothetical protein GL284_02685 [Paracoccus sp. DK608]|uniref:Cellulose biosynthesis protein BcsS n=2 Tax=Paracoccus shanxieyensis TaxID=2675752 RepID=A0A6L6IV45_9RHOB|nr:hypothetical protein [Paracoccus shanxieyensis]MTH63172.1 hypothetical protein [Paracoccus shanxieyensis]MTH87086.1 hypothetical protein [Paracoccus shanxieyensis]